MNVSNTTWSSFSQADYDDEQWQRATILDHGTGNAPKERYGLPVREPHGTLNPHAVHAAAARHAGADAPADARHAAAAALVGLYRQLEEMPPESIIKLAGS
jgi:hypothetical protein